jgi:hypothetical protein
MMLDDAASTLAYILPASVQPWSGVEKSLEHKGPQFKFVVRGGDAATSVYARTESDKSFIGHFVKLKQIENDRTLWVEDSPGPSPQAMGWAQVVLQRLKASEFEPTRVVASAQGGVAFCFLKGKKYADIECLNNGSILGVISDEYGRPVAWEIGADPNSISEAAARIRAFVVSSPTK